MSLRRVETGPELAEVESLASDWSESPHQPALSEETRLQLRSGRGTAFVLDRPRGVATLSTTKRPAVGMIEVTVPRHVSASDFWDRAEPGVKLAAAGEGYSVLELLTWDAGLRGELEDRGWQRVRTIHRGTRTDSPAPNSGTAHLPASPALPGTPSVAFGDTSPNVASLLGEEMLTSFTGGRNDTDQLLEVNNLAFGSHPEAGNWDLAGLEMLFEEPWYDPAGLLVTRDGPLVTGFCWTKVHPDEVGEIYLLSVRPEYSGRGLGRSLVIAAVDHLTAERGCEQVIVYWDASNSAASNLYQSIGFSIDRLGEVFRHRL